MILNWMWEFGSQIGEDMAKKKAAKKKTTKKTRAQRKTSRGKRKTPRWRLRESFILAVTKPEEIDEVVPEGFEIQHVEGLGVLGRKLWLHVSVMPKD